MSVPRRALLLSLASAALAGGVPRPPRLPTLPEPLVLRLPPSALGRDLALQQRMTLTVFGRTQQMDLALEADREAVRLAVLAFGQTLARLDWDGRELKESRAPGWPPMVTGARVLSDLQLVHWPADAIRSVLPPGWTLQADATGRALEVDGRTLIRVRYPAPGTAELDNVVGHYRLRLEDAQ